MTPEICPNCGAAVPPKARACPACGSDETTGWGEDASTGHLDLPSEEFDYEEFVREEFGARKPIPRGIHWFWWVVAIVLAGCFVLFVIR